MKSVRYLYLCLGTFLCSAIAVQAQTTIWSMDPVSFSSGGGGVVLGDQTGQLVQPTSDWGMGLGNWLQIENPMSSTNLADYTFSATVLTDVTNYGVGFSLNFYDGGPGSTQLGTYRLEWATLRPTEQEYVYTLDQFAENNALEAHEFAQVTHIEYIVGGLNVQDAVYQFDAHSLTVIPEPGTYAAIFGVSFLGLALWIRRRRQV